MPDFSTLQGQLQETRASVEAEQRRIFVEGQGVKRLGLEKQRVSRSQGTQSDAYQALLGQEAERKRTIAESKKRLSQLRNDRGALLEEFATFMDPRENLERLSDSHPILLFPVRLETRFKVLPGAGGGERHQLWVRIFPDECSIDTFDDVPSESERIRIHNYWTAVWKAGAAGSEAVEGLVRDKRMGAWRKLMGAFNAGRAHWLTTRIRPQNEADIPGRNLRSDRIFVIPTDDPPPPAVQDALKVYWEAVFRAAGDQQAIDAALAALVAATGGDEEGARALAAAYVPQNLEEPPDEPASDPAVTVVFLVFDPDVDVKLSAWSQAARVRNFPEKFVLLGYQGNDAPPVVTELGARVPDPLVVGPDTRDDVEALLVEEFGDEIAALSDEEKAAKYVEYLAQRSETRWLFDFDRAVEAGLGFRVDLSPEQYREGFTRLLVLGVQLGADAEAGRLSLEELLRNHQFGDSGFSLLAQGTPTNNTEEAGSGHSEREDAEEAWERYETDTPPHDPTEPSQQCDGRRLAEALGIDPEAAALTTARNYFGRDQLEARAMHTALWNATIGYYLESMVPPVASDGERDIVRAHLLEHVRGRGALPAIRIGDQPYGILPVSDMGNLVWLSQKPLPIRLDPGTIEVLRGLYAALLVMRQDLRPQLAEVAHVGKYADPHQVLLQALGLHASSVEFDRRIAQSFDQLKNALYLQALFGANLELQHQSYKGAGLTLLERLGYQHDAEADPEIPLLTRYFLGPQEDVTKDVVDDNPLSEERRIRAYTDAGQNYIEWLIENARNDHAKIRHQQGFSGNQPPSALLYDLLRHALNLEFGNASIRLYELAGVLDAAESSRCRMDAEFIGVQVDSDLLQSKWDLLDRPDERVAPAGTLVADRIVELVRTGLPEPATNRLQEVIEALELLKDTPTARLERCLAEHLDCCHYRMDAWLLSFLHLQLRAMRQAFHGEDEGLRRGIHLGAFGWVENLKPEDKDLVPAVLDESAREIFDPEDSGEIVTDSKNGGYLHAPSIPHGLTAAVLRNSYISTASRDDAERYKVNLSSERVRMALAIIEGMQQGQGLAELLGYRLERGLHDNNDQELDVFIYELRKVFSLASNRLKPTAIKTGKIPRTVLEAVRFQEEAQEFEEDDAVTKVEARNVVNGLALLDHVETTGERNYPFGFPIGTGAGKLRDATADERAAIDREVEKLRNLRDAVADLAIAESVHQTIQGNYDRAAGALDAYSKGAFPQLPDVIQSPASGLSLSHRFGIHLPAGVSPDAGATPRSKAEPAVNAWLADLFPASDEIVCRLRFRVPVYEGEIENAWSELPVSLQDLGLEPIDLLYLFDAESQKNLSALDDHVLRFFRSGGPQRLDLEIEIDYAQAAGDHFTFFELGALLAELRTLVLAARPLEPSDIALQQEGDKAQNATASVDPERITKARMMLDASLLGLGTDVIDVFSPLVDPEDAEVGLAHFGSILASFDTAANRFVQHMSAIALFGGEGAGSGFVHQRQREISMALYARMLAFRRRWDDVSDRYEGLIDVDLPAAPDDEQKIAILQKAEALISTTFTTSFADAADLLTKVQARKAQFDLKHVEVAAFLTTAFTDLPDQYDAAEAVISGMDAFDREPLDIAAERRQLVALVEDLLGQAQQLRDRATQGSAEVQALVTAAEGATPPDKLDAMKQAASLLFGEGFQLLPEFRLPDERAKELQNCLDDQAQLLAHQTNALGSDFPVDDWLYGVARVREKLAAWENLVVLAEGFKDRPSIDLTPFQLPYQEQDSWLALAYPESHVVAGDSLLYTAYAPGMDPTGPQVGLLVDEWTETVPSPQETTALTFHYDRPNCEAPQAMLLATPASMNGAWSWEELVASLHAALELARLRALEPDLLDETSYARLLPATVAALTYRPVTMAVDFALKAVATSA